MGRRGRDRGEQIKRGRRQLREVYRGTNPCGLCGGKGWVTGCPSCKKRWRSE